MVDWIRQILRGPIPAAFAVCAVFVAAGTWLARPTGGAPAPAPTFYGTQGALSAEPGANVTSATVGAYESASVHHLRVAGGVKTHVHHRHDETVTILSGEGRMRLGDETRDVGPGTVLLVPRGTLHSLEVIAGPMEAVSVFSPAFDGKDRLFVDE